MKARQGRGVTPEGPHLDGTAEEANFPVYGSGGCEAESSSRAGARSRKGIYHAGFLTSSAVLPDSPAAGVVPQGVGPC